MIKTLLGQVKEFKLVSLLTPFRYVGGSNC